MNLKRIPDLWVRCSKYVTHSVSKSWRSAAYMAALAAIAGHVGLLTVLAKFSMIIVANLAAGTVSTPAVIDVDAPLVVAIDDEAFQDRYLERSPLNRCALLDDLKQITSWKPEIVAIDLDLSPLIGANEDEHDCQKRLDDHLDANPETLVLLSPFPVRSTALRETKLQWMEDRCKHGLHFADGRLETSLGMVIEERHPADSSLAKVTRDKYDKKDDENNSICELVLRDRVDASTALLSPEGSSAIDKERTAEAHRRPINFQAAAQLVPRSLTVNSETLQSLADLGGRVVFFGGQWGSDDTFDTPVGEQPGVWIHAARFVTQARPVRELSEIWALLVDIIIAFIFSMLITSFWGLYFDLKVMEAEPVPSQPEQSAPQSRLSLWMNKIGKSVRRNSAWGTTVVMAFVIAYLMLTITFFLIARHLFVSHGLLIAPLLIAISMLAHGFVAGPVEVMCEREVDPKHRRRATAATIHRCITAVVLVVCCGVPLMGLIISTPKAGLVVTYIFATLVLIMLVMIISSFFELSVPRSRKPAAVLAQTPEQPAASSQDSPATANSAQQSWRIAHPRFSAFGNALSIVRFFTYWGVLVYAMYIAFKHL